MPNQDQLMIDAANRYYDNVIKDENSRFRSWEHCYKCFCDARSCSNPDYDYLSLQLFSFLASWGMLRGDAFIAQKDYKIHIHVVSEILAPKYDCLLGLECCNLHKHEDMLWELADSLEAYYEKVRTSVKGAVDTDISQTLITKILLGALGCAPAYDRYLQYAVRKLGMATGTFSKKSLRKLADFYTNNEPRFESARTKFKANGLQYPQMKFLDMALWQYGYENIQTVTEEGKA